MRNAGYPDGASTGCNRKKSGSRGSRFLFSRTQQLQSYLLFKVTPVLVTVMEMVILEGSFLPIFTGAAKLNFG